MGVEGKARRIVPAFFIFVFVSEFRENMHKTLACHAATEVCICDPMYGNSQSRHGKFVFFVVVVDALVALVTGDAEPRRKKRVLRSKKTSRKVACSRLFKRAFSHDIDALWAIRSSWKMSGSAIRLIFVSKLSSCPSHPQLDAAFFCTLVG